MTCNGRCISLPNRHQPRPKMLKYFSSFVTSVSIFGVGFLEVLGSLKVLCIPKILLKRSPKVKQNVGLSMVV